MVTPVQALNGQAELRSAVITNSASLSSALDLGTNRLAQIVIPSSWTTANLTFQTSADGTTYNDLYNAGGTEISVTVGGASRAIVLAPADFISVRYLKVRSGTSGTPVNQGGQRVLTLVLVP